MSSCGKRGGGRVIVAFKNNKHLFFMFGYLKNELSNIDQSELKALKQYAQYLFSLRDHHITSLLKAGELFELQ